jgi:hypothetical protein
LEPQAAAGAFPAAGAVWQNQGILIKSITRHGNGIRRHGTALARCRNITPVMPQHFFRDVAGMLLLSHCP